MNDGIALGLASLFAGLTGGIGQQMAAKDQAERQAKHEKETMVRQAEIQMLIEKAKSGDLGFLQTKEGQRSLKGVEEFMPALVGTFGAWRNTQKQLQDQLKQQTAQGFQQPQMVPSGPQGQLQPHPMFKQDSRTPEQVQMTGQIQSQLDQGQVGQAKSLYENQGAMSEQMEVRRLQLEKMRLENQKLGAETREIEAKPGLELAKAEQKAFQDALGRVDKVENFWMETFVKWSMDRKQDPAKTRALYEAWNRGEPQAIQAVQQLLANLPAEEATRVSGSMAGMSAAGHKRTLLDKLGELRKQSGGEAIPVDSELGRQMSSEIEAYNNALGEQIRNSLAQLIRAQKVMIVPVGNGELAIDPSSLGALGDLRALAQEFMNPGVKDKGWVFKNEVLEPSFAGEGKASGLPIKELNLNLGSLGTLKLHYDPNSGELVELEGKSVEGSSQGGETPEPSPTFNQDGILDRTEIDEPSDQLPPAEQLQVAQEEKSPLREAYEGITSSVGVPKGLTSTLTDVASATPLGVASETLSSPGEERRKNLTIPGGQEQAQKEVQFNNTLQALGQDERVSPRVKKLAQELKRIRVLARQQEGLSGVTQVGLGQGFWKGRQEYLEKVFEPLKGVSKQSPTDSQLAQIEGVVNPEDKTGENIKAGLNSAWAKTMEGKAWVEQKAQEIYAYGNTPEKQASRAKTVQNIKNHLQEVKDKVGSEVADRIWEAAMRKNSTPPKRRSLSEWKAPQEVAKRRALSEWKPEKKSPEFLKAQQDSIEYQQRSVQLLTQKKNQLEGRIAEMERRDSKVWGKVNTVKLKEQLKTLKEELSYREEMVADLWKSIE